jgi:hypothetical protein
MLISIRDLKDLKLATIEKHFLQVLYRRTKLHIKETNLIEDFVSLTSDEIKRDLLSEFGIQSDELSWTLQLLLDLSLVERVQNKVSLSKTGRIYTAFLEKDLLT